MDKRSQVINNVMSTAYDIYTDAKRSESAQYNDMQRYLNDMVNYGAITFKEKCNIAHDVIETSFM